MPSTYREIMARQWRSSPIRKSAPLGDNFRRIMAMAKSILVTDRSTASGGAAMHPTAALAAYHWRSARSAAERVLRNDRGCSFEYPPVGRVPVTRNICCASLSVFGSFTLNCEFAPVMRDRLWRGDGFLGTRAKPPNVAAMSQPICDTNVVQNRLLRGHVAEVADVAR
jgi:hypothetical protein